jgi:hypothetical protein
MTKHRAMTSQNMPGISPHAKPRRKNMADEDRAKYKVQWRYTGGNLYGAQIALDESQEIDLYRDEADYLNRASPGMLKKVRQTQQKSKRQNRQEVNQTGDARGKK